MKKVMCLIRIGVATAFIVPGLTGVCQAAAQDLQTLVDEAYAKFKDDKTGANADYIPALAEVPSELFGVVVVTADGKVYSAGDVDYTFSIQSCGKVFTLCRVIQDSGPDAVLEKIGVEPTGERFNSIRAIEEGDGRADNPMVNAGAIAAVSMVKAKNADERWNRILGTMNDFAGEELKLMPDIYTSEAETNFRNRGIAHVLFNTGHLYAEPLECTDVYTKECSVGVNCKQLANMGATLANRGVNPITGKKCIDAKNVPEVLAVMMSCGFYDESGEWMWEAGLPAKTGVGGGIFAVVPGKMCIAGFSPRLNEAGNSIRSTKAILYIAEALDLNLFGSGK